MPDQEEERGQPAGLADYLKVIRERWWIIAVAVVVVMVVMLEPAVRATHLYRATSQLVYQTNNLDKAIFGAQIFDTTDPTRSVDTAAELITTAPVADAVKAQLGTGVSAGALLGMISANSSTTTNILEIQAVSSDPQFAADVANAFANQFVLFRQNADKQTVAAAQEQVKAQLDGLSAADANSDYGLMLKEKYESLQILGAMQTGGFAVVQSATPPSSPFSPRPTRSGLIGLAGGLVLGLGIAFLLDHLDRRLKDVKAVEQAFGYPVLTTLPTVGRWPRWLGRGRGNHAVGFRSRPALLEGFRALRSTLQFFDVDRKTKTILVTSGLPNEGKTTTVINLALSMVLAGFRVIVVEADLRRPTVTEYLNVDNRAGLSTLLAGGGTIADALRPVNVESFLPDISRDKAGNGNAPATPRAFYCVPSGPVPPNPAELLSSERMARLIEEMNLNRRVDYVLIDTPPILSVTDALVIAPEVDAVIIASKLNWTTKEEAEEVGERFRRAGARVIGVVAGGAKSRGSSYRRGRYYHY